MIQAACFWSRMCGSREGDRGSGPPPPWKILKIKGFLAIQVWIPWKSQSYQAMIECWVIIGTPAKRHLNGVSLAGRWWPRLYPLIKWKKRKKEINVVKVGPPLTKLSGSAHEVLRVFLSYFLTWYPRYLSRSQLTVEYTIDRPFLGLQLRYMWKGPSLVKFWMRYWRKSCQYDRSSEDFRQCRYLYQVISFFNIFNFVDINVNV